MKPYLLESRSPAYIPKDLSEKQFCEKMKEDYESIRDTIYILFGDSSQDTELALGFLLSSWDALQRHLIKEGCHPCH